MRNIIALCWLLAARLTLDEAAAQAFRRPIQLSEAEEIALALSAAPPHIATAATVLVLGATGYQTARSGTNGFTCLVEHEDPKAIEPVCYDAEGSATTLEVARYLARARSEGRPDSVTQKEIAEGYRTGRFLSPRRAGIAYMLSPRASIPPHVMMYAPYATTASLGLPVAGSGSRGVPMLYNPGQPNAYVIVMVPDDANWIGRHAARSAPAIGSALQDGTQLIYESGGVTQAPWVFDSVRVAARATFERCVLVSRRAQPAREYCARSRSCAADSHRSSGDCNSHDL